MVKRVGILLFFAIAAFPPASREKQPLGLIQACAPIYHLPGSDERAYIEQPHQP